MNNDVLKSLGYLKKSLKMSHKAISNAISKDAQVLVEMGVIATGIHNLIKEIDSIEAQGNYVPVTSSPSSPTAPSIIPVPTLGATSTDDSGSGINFLDPS